MYVKKILSLKKYYFVPKQNFYALFDIIVSFGEMDKCVPCYCVAKARSLS